MAQVKANKTISYSLLIILLYIYIFNPVFKWPDFGLNVILLGLSGVYSILNFNLFKKYLSAYKTEILLIIVGTLYLFVRLSNLRNDHVADSFRLLDMLLDQLFIPFFLINAFWLKHTEKGFLNTIIIVGLIAASITISCVLFPPLQNIVRGIQTERELGALERLDAIDLRSFGLAANLTSAYGFMMGLCGAICVAKMSNMRFYNVFYILLFVFAAAVNARTGILAIVVAVAIISFDGVRHFSLGKRVAGLVLLLFLLYMLFMIVKTYLPRVFEFVSVFIDFFSSTGNYEDSVYDHMLHFPKTIEGLWLGEGRNVMGIGTYERSDIGFVRDIYLGGLVFAILLALEQFVLYKKIYKRSGDRILTLVLLSCVLIFYYKGCLVYTTTAVSRFIMLYYFVLVNNIIKPYRKITIFK